METILNIMDIVACRFENNRNPINANAMSRYMKGHFDYYGIKTEDRRALYKEFYTDFKKMEWSEIEYFVNLCWSREEREWQHFGIDVMKKKLRTISIDQLPFVEQLILSKSWWDTVDWLAPHGIATIVKNSAINPETMVIRYLDSGNKWLQRSAIIFQLFYKQSTDTHLIEYAIQHRKDDPEFFVQKAIGWMLRQYSRTNPHYVSDIVDTNPSLSNLAKREAIKLLR